MKIWEQDDTESLFPEQRHIPCTLYDLNSKRMGKSGTIFMQRILPKKIQESNAVLIKILLPLYWHTHCTRITYNKVHYPDLFKIKKNFLLHSTIKLSTEKMVVALPRQELQLHFPQQLGFQWVVESQVPHPMGF